MLLLLVESATAWRGLAPCSLPPLSLPQTPQRNAPVYMYQDVRALGDLVLDEDGEIVGRERAVERVAASIKALQDRGGLKAQPSATTPTRKTPEGLLPPSVLPPSLSSQRFATKHSAGSQPMRLMAIVAAACFAIATTVVFPSRAAETAVAPPQQQQQVAAAAALSEAQIEARMKSIPVTAIVNDQGQPYMIDKERDVNLGFFYLEPSDALLDLQACSSPTTHRLPQPLPTYHVPLSPP